MLITNYKFQITSVILRCLLNKLELHGWIATIMIIIIFIIKRLKGRFAPIFFICEHLFFAQYKTRTKKVCFCEHQYIYTFIVRLQRVCLLSITPKTAEPIRPKFVWDLAWPQGRYYWRSNYKNLPLTKLDFWNPRNYYINFVFCSYLQCMQREHVHN